jgi:hypothetical protein
MPPRFVMNYFGEARVPRSIKAQRRSNLGLMRDMGAPVIIKHMYNAEDEQKGIAKKSPNWNSAYGQTRHNDPVSHGVGFVSVENSPNEWISPDGRQIVVSTTSPGIGYTAAPLHRGYGPGYLTYVILPDVSEDLFKMSETGVLIRTQQAQVQMGWYPEVNDNDLIISVELDQAGTVIADRERWQAKQTNPISMRGMDRRGRREYTEDFGNRYVTDQQFEMSLVPSNDELYNVEIDR